MSLNISFLQCDSTNYRVGSNREIKYVVVHYTGNDGDTAKANATYFANTKNIKASAHYFVDENEIWQSVRERDVAWHCGATTYKHAECRNDNSIGVEICSRKNGGGYYFKDEAVAKAAELIKELAAKYDIPADNVLRHYDVTGKICPAPFVEDPAKWTAFKNRIFGKGVTIEELRTMGYTNIIL